MLWVDKYRPKTVDDVVCNARHLAAINHFLAVPPSGRCLFVYGPPGTGKSTIINLLVPKALRPDHDDALDILQNVMPDFVVLLDNADGFSQIKQLCDAIKLCPCHVICVANDGDSKKMRTLRGRAAVTIRWPRLLPSQIMLRLTHIAKTENISTKGLEGYAACGDLRSAINNLQFGHFEGTDRTVPNIFETTAALFGGTLNLQERVRYLESDTVMSLMVHENYLRRTPSFEGAEFFSDADMLHYLEEATVLNIGATYYGMIRPAEMKFPALLGKTSAANATKRQMRDISRHFLEDGRLLRLRLCPTCKEDIPDIVARMREMDITKENWAFLFRFQKVPPQLKAALSRALKKRKATRPGKSVAKKTKINIKN